MQEFVHFQDLLARKLTEYRDVLMFLRISILESAVRLPINLMGIPG